MSAFPHYSPSQIDVLAVMDLEISVWAGRMSAREWWKRWPTARQTHAGLVEARDAVAELIAERDRLANIVRSHEAQIARMTSERAELVAAAKYAEQDEYTHRACVRLHAALARFEVQP